MKSLAVVITDRDEPYLPQTIVSAKKAGTRACMPSIVVVQDGGKRKRSLGKWGTAKDSHHLPWQESRGCQAARDFGIMEAKTDVVCVVDAHMDFEAGLWGDMMALLAEMGGIGVVGCGCGGLEPKQWKRMDDPRYFAYPIAWEEGKPVQFKWNYARRLVARAFGAMGACYMFSREWYVDALLRPWQFGTGWGYDEECLTMANFLAGGDVRVSEKVAWHWFRSQKELPYSCAGVSLYGQVANAMRVWDMFPSEDATYGRAMGMLAQWPLAQVRASAIQQLRDQQEAAVSEYAEKFAELYPAASLDAFLSRCISLQQYMAIDSRSVETPVQSAQTAPVRRPERKESASNETECRKCGAVARHIHTYPNGNELMECSVCRMKHIRRTA